MSERSPRSEVGILPKPCDSLKYARGCDCAKCVVHEMARGEQWNDEAPRRALVGAANEARLSRFPHHRNLVLDDAGERGDTTDCGRDCTGPDWWHQS